jgi:hypothetical protein
MATFTINIDAFEDPIVACSGTVIPNQSLGIYETTFEIGSDTGTTGINYDAVNVPDRFQIEYDGVIVADSKYVGNGLSGNPLTYSGLVDTFDNLTIYEYDGSGYINTGTNSTITVTQGDISNDTISHPSAGAGTLTFSKTTASPTIMKVIVTAPLSGTGWSMSSICPIPFG